ncbi:Hypothetical protein PHPALM_5972 [Phytophthora palmivora]|uniref:Uncharacterized protein n=1 Tax=Phytophthora palmivora TaxID=4796 RepID=A0A2P4YGB2_9STRA|nr:Hypothetical protein PHPALM_5972 [Phytophthora palmivora]
MDGTSSQDKNRKRQRDSSQEQDKPKRRATDVAVNHLEAAESDAKLLVAFMKLFLDGGFELDTIAPNYRDRVLDLSKRTEDPSIPA